MSYPDHTIAAQHPLAHLTSETRTSAEGDFAYDFPEDPFGYEGSYNNAEPCDYPPQVGDGDYHRHLHPFIHLSPHATKTAQKSAQYQKDAIQQAVGQADPNIYTDLGHLDDQTLVSLAADAAWTVSPAGSLAPPQTPIITPKPHHPVASAKEMETLFTPTPKQKEFQAAVFDAMGFQPLDLPPPPQPVPRKSAPFEAPLHDTDAPPRDSDTPEGISGGPGGDMVGEFASGTGDDAPGRGDSVDAGGQEPYSGSGNQRDGSGTDNENSNGEQRPSGKGRPSTAVQKQITELFTEVNRLFSEASNKTGRSVSSLVERWNNLSKYGTKSSVWNTYQHYYMKNTEKERQCAGLPDGTVFGSSLTGKAP
ncbi:hypothetical protein BDZ94DRAFT_1296054 [Collybia nuda]|uniref:Uncharacterized protein n=1 Tax=Collybia nuda TaxID=64659 RepID=A0A9P5YBH3_9AGAR|nr:hypothetical protein BDZ94DRAFT_1296054 [Collybia nuda]